MKRLSFSVSVFTISSLCLFVCPLRGHTQQLSEKLFTPPPRYRVLKMEDSLQIDGLAREAAWEKAPWMGPFKSIDDESINQGDETRAKMLWDDQYLYLYVEMKEADLWATLKQHDTSIFRENALEVFMDPDSDNQHYLEFQINALGTVWDLLMTKPYRNGGRSLSDWDVKGLKKAVYVRGSLNQPDNRDEGWFIELAFPLKNVAMGSRVKPVPGSIWRMNLSRVEWPLKVQNGQYVKQEGTQGKAVEPAYWVWAPQGVVNLHMPERWGYLLLADEKGYVGEAMSRLDSLDQATKLVWKGYYLQEMYKKKYGHFAVDFSELNKAFPADRMPAEAMLSMDADIRQFWIAYSSSPDHLLIAVDQEGKVYFDWP